MADAQTPVSALQNILKSAKAATSASPVLGHQSQHFWQAQDRALSELENFSKHWFERRHIAAQSALESSRAIAEQGTNNPAAAMTRLSEWQSQSFKRLTEDAQAFTEMMANCIGAVVQNEIEAAEETVESTKQAMKQSKATPV